MNVAQFEAKWRSLLAERPSFESMMMESCHQVVTATVAVRTEVRWNMDGKSASMTLLYVSDINTPYEERFTVVEGIGVLEVKTWQE
jgi:hypothetical protein